MQDAPSTSESISSPTTANGDVVLLTFGSSGDLNPFLALGTELQRRGRRVTLISNTRYAADAERHGFAFDGIGSIDEFDEFVNNPDAWHPSRGAKLVFGAVSRYASESYEKLQKHVGDATTIVAGTLGMAGRVMHDASGSRLVTVHLSPTCFRSHVQPPRLPGVPYLGWLPEKIRPAVLRHFWNGADRYVLDKHLSGVNDLRESVGLERVEGLMGDHLHAPMRTLAMWPDWFSPAPADYPEQARLVGFPLYDERQSAPMPPEVEAFLQAGAPPIVFTPGSAMAHGKRFFKAAVAACEKLNARGLLVSKYTAHLPSDLPPGVKAVSYAPFTELLPRCRAIAHHGGIGTISQALAAGLPQLIMPMAHDQPDNASRLRTLRVAESLKPRKFTGGRVAKAFRRLLSDDSVARCRDVATWIDRGEGIQAACDEIELVADLPV